MGQKRLAEEEKAVRNKHQIALQLKKLRMDPESKADDNELQNKRRKRKMEAPLKSSKTPTA